MDRGGDVVTGDCRAWRGDLAARALGRADPARDAGLDAHLDGCPECRAELDDLRAVAGALDRADPSHLEHVVPHPALAERVLHRVAAASAARRRRHRLLAVAGGALGAAAAVVLAVVLAAGGAGDDDPDAEVVLEGRGDASGSAALVERSWGTEVHLEVSGLDAGEVYWLWLSSDDGDRVAAGTLSGTGGESTAVLAAALPIAEADRVWMTDEQDAVVLDARVRN